MRRGVRWIVVGVAVLAVAFVLFEWLLPAMLVRLAENAAAEAGFPDARVSAVDVGFNRTTIGEIALDAGGTNVIGPVHIDYTLADLQRRRVRSVTITGLAATLDNAVVRIAHPSLEIPSATGRIRVDLAADGGLAYRADLQAPFVTVVDVA
ncbi:MAG: hypothetical protein EXQ94_02880 [Alphaproteobacteria bacterium]|nr:hypothetical protein [Alphaproteobacteria bacterium]